MTNRDLHIILQKIEKQENLNLSELSKKADVDRSYLSKVINMKMEKKIGVRVLNKLKSTYPSYFTENNKSHTPTGNYALPGEGVVTIEDHIRTLKEHNKFLQGLLSERVEAIDQNLKKTLAYAGRVSLRMDAASSVALESLARLEKMPKGSLNAELGKEVARLLKGPKKQDS